MTEPLFYLRGHTSGISAVEFANNDQNILSGDQSGVIKIWSLKDRMHISEINTKFDSILSLFVLESNDIISQHRLGHVVLWDCTTNKSVHTFSTNSLSFSKICPINETTFLSPTHIDGGVSLLDFRQKEIIHNFKEMPDKQNMSITNILYPLNCPILNSQRDYATYFQNYFYTILESSEIVCYDLRTKKVVKTSNPIFGTLQQPTSAIHIQPSHMWVGNSNGSIAHCSINKDIDISVNHITNTFPKISSTASKYDDPVDRIPVNAPEEIQHQLGISQFAVRKDCRLVVAAGWDHRIRLFETATRRLLATLLAHNAPILSVSFGKKLGAFAASSRDGRISVWNTYVDSCV